MASVRALVDGRTVDGVDQRAQQRVAGEHEHGQRDRLEGEIGAGAGADRGRAPQRRRGVEAPDIAALLHDHAGAEEADAGDDIGDDLGRAGIAVEMHADIDKGGGADAPPAHVVRKPPPRWRYCRSAPISVPSTKAANRLTSELRKSGSVKE